LLLGVVGECNLSLSLSLRSLAPLVICECYAVVIATDNPSAVISYPPALLFAVPFPIDGKKSDYLLSKPLRENNYYPLFFPCPLSGFSFKSLPLRETS
jgi:hypothetical protein